MRPEYIELPEELGVQAIKGNIPGNPFIRNLVLSAKEDAHASIGEFVHDLPDLLGTGKQGNPRPFDPLPAQELQKMIESGIVPAGDFFDPHCLPICPGFAARPGQCKAEGQP